MADYLARKGTVSKQSGPTYVNSTAMSGVKARYVVPIPIPDPVTLPTTWIPPVLPSEDTLRINFVLEQEVLKQAEIRRLAMVGEASSPSASIKSLTESLNSNIPLIPYHHTAILTPVPVATATGTSKDSPGGSVITGMTGSQQGSSNALASTLGELSLRDFEGDANDPFEMTTLQAIDDMAELQSVLQPELARTSAVSTASTSVSHSSRPVPPPKPVSYRPSHPTNPDPTSIHRPSFPLHVPVSPHINPSSATVARPSLGSSPGSHDHSVGTLINIDPSEPSPPIPLVQPTPQLPPYPGTSRPSLPPVAPKPRMSSSVPIAGPSPAVARVPGILPPISGPLSGHHRPLGGVSVLPPISGAVPVLPPPSSHAPPIRSTHPPLAQSVPPQPEMVLPPPYSVHVPASHISVNPSPCSSMSGPTPCSYQLPDVQASLTAEQKNTLVGISGMGFPAPRVARALKEFDGDDSKVIEFLVLVGELEEKGHNGDSAETALLVHKQDVNKSLDYLKQVAQYSEVWSESDIHDAYQRSEGDWDKSIDILTQGR